MTIFLNQLVRKRLEILTLSLCLLTAWNPAFAEKTVLVLNRLSLANVDDSIGRYQHAGGEVFLDGGKIGNYTLSRRYTTDGTEEQNTATLTLTILVLGEDPPQNTTIQGAHSFNNGRYNGSVSAASSELSFLIDTDADLVIYGAGPLVDSSSQ